MPYNKICLIFISRAQRLKAVELIWAEGNQEDVTTEYNIQSGLVRRPWWLTVRERPASVLQAEQLSVGSETFLYVLADCHT